MAVSVVESAPIMSMALSPDNAYILVNLASHTIHLWPLESMLRQLEAMHRGRIPPGLFPFIVCPLSLSQCLLFTCALHPTNRESVLHLHAL
jgi:hypothetical protein